MPLWRGVVFLNMIAFRGTTGRYFAKKVPLREGAGTRVRYFAILTPIWTIEWRWNKSL
ncbi:hypothetical protein J2Z65_006263 [Paenibacillus aceris]|uniref:Uncharacterized protein n=1 Tax=Paenibacillus aceris TaxID=869555 RepID=A0ABS4I7W0_9BACL|nr:hypothetical protein [Paenibacillus aceris]